jgi:predicted transposase/invertase (TIGR01784 family)
MSIRDKYIDPFTDFGFKHIFGTEKNKKFLISFLNDLLELDDKIIDLTYRSLEKLGLKITDRKAIFDVYCTDEKDNNFIVELQRSEQKYFKDRSIYYTTFPIQEQSKKGTWDYELTKIYFIGILEFAFDDMRLKENKDNTSTKKGEETYLTEVKLYNHRSKKLFYDKLTYFYLEMPKFRKTEKELSTHLDKWLYYLNNLSIATEIPESLQDEEIFQEAFSVAEFLALNKNEQFQYQQDLKARWDNEACLDFAKEKGFNKGKEQGLEQGERNKQIEIARNLLKANITIETISLSTGLNIDEIEELVKN